MSGVVVKDAKKLCELASEELNFIFSKNGVLYSEDIARVVSKYFGLDLGYDVNYGVLIFKEDQNDDENR